MFLCDAWFEVTVVMVGFFQPAKSVGGRRWFARRNSSRCPRCRNAGTILALDTVIMKCPAHFHQIWPEPEKIQADEIFLP
jgi:hypothetical protein